MSNRQPQCNECWLYDRPNCQHAGRHTNFPDGPQPAPWWVPVLFFTVGIPLIAIIYAIVLSGVIH